MHWRVIGGKEITSGPMRFLKTIDPAKVEAATA